MTVRQTRKGLGRSPWTLASDAVWERTHRVAGWVFMVAGLLVVVLTLAGGPRWLTLSRCSSRPD
ncbi:MAG: SdpI family protein [Rhodanobacter sp.]|nr:MAG: SdpI family protein [Rhodanobacter sp.]